MSHLSLPTNAGSVISVLLFTPGVPGMEHAQSPMCLSDMYSFQDK